MRAVFTCLLLLLLSSPAAAYTLVMRGGRRVEVADDFRLFAGQLTYEAAPGVSVTLPLDMVDVPATERANDEPPGSFLRRATAPPQTAERGQAETQKSATLPRPPSRLVTNRELEPVRRARVESERAYERRRAELGLPSAEEARRREQEEERALSERARRKAEEDAEAEDYWRSRAAALREEATAFDAEINYLRNLLEEMSDNSAAGFSSSSGLAAGALTVVAGPRAFFGGRGGFGRPNFAPNLPTGTAFARNPANVLLSQNSGGRRFTRAGAFAGVNIGGGTRARFGFGRFGTTRGKFAPSFRRGPFAFGRAPFFAPGIVSVVAPFDYASADAYALATRLRLLEAERAGVAARWRLLEEEARRAGAMPGWLRP